MYKGWLIVSMMVGACPVYGVAQKTVSDQHEIKNNRYCIVLAGGSGERLWPLSRQEKPKQFLTLNQHDTFIEQMIDHVSAVVSSEKIWVSTTEQYACVTKEMLADRVGRVLVEPGSRNTGPALLLSCLELYAIDPQAVVLFVPADAFIPSHDSSAFAAYLDQAFEYAASHNRITLLGVKPTYPATGYGYIEFISDENKPPYSVKKFHEKPGRLIAQGYCQSETMLWNIGMFCGAVSVFIDEFKKHAPAMTEGVIAYYEGRAPYGVVPSESVDYAVMEKTKSISVLPVDFSWCDVGNLEIFLSLQKQFGSDASEGSAHIAINAHNNLVHAGNQLVALIDVDNICVVQTDDVLLIAKRDATEQVKMVVTQLKRTAQQKYL